MVNKKIHNTLQKITNSPFLIIFIVLITLFGLLYATLILPTTKFSQNNQSVILNKENTSPSPSLQPTTLPTNPPSTTKTQTLPVLNGGNIFNLVNTYRSANGKPFLSVSSELCRLAEIRADYMMTNNMAAFKSSESGGHTGLSDITSQYSGGGVGENLAANLNTDASVIEIWKNSPPHRELMLWTEKEGFPITKGCVATRVSEIGSIVVLLIGDN